MNEGLLARLARQAGVPDLLDVLTEKLAPSDVQSLLLEVYVRLASHVSPGQVLEQYASNRFVAPSSADPRMLVELDRQALALLPDGYIPLELSPLCPLGTTSVVGPVSQNNVVSTIRNTEVVADSTNVLALECALRRRRLKRDADRVREPVLLAASQRVTRSQVFKGAGLSAHFRLFSLVAAGRDEGSYRFEARHLLEQMSFYVRLLREAPPIGSAFREIRLSVADFTGGRLADTLQEQVLQPLSARFPDVDGAIDPNRSDGRGYYDDVRFNVFATDASKQELHLVDGGVTRWTRRLLSDEKERLVISGLGLERLCRASAPPQT